MVKDLRKFVILTLVLSLVIGISVFPPVYATSMRITDFYIEQAHDAANVYNYFKRPEVGDSLNFYLSFYYDPNEDGECTIYYKFIDGTGAQVTSTTSVDVPPFLPTTISGDYSADVTVTPAGDYIYVEPWVECTGTTTVFYPTPATLKVWRDTTTTITITSGAFSATTSTMYIDDETTIHVVSAWKDDGTAAEGLEYVLYAPDSATVATGTLGSGGTADIVLTPDQVGTYKLLMGSGEEIDIPADYYEIPLSDLNQGDLSTNDGDFDLFVQSDAANFDAEKGVFTSTPTASTSIVFGITWYHMPDLPIPAVVKPTYTFNYCSSCGYNNQQLTVTVPAHSGGTFTATFELTIDQDDTTLADYAYTRISALPMLYSTDGGTTWNNYYAYYWMWGKDFFDSLTLPALPVGKGFTETISGVLKVYKNNSWDPAYSWTLGNHPKYELGDVYIYMQAPDGTEEPVYYVDADGSFNFSYTFTQTGTYTMKGLFQAALEIPVVEVAAATITNIQLTDVSKFPEAPTATYSVDFKGIATRLATASPESATITVDLLVDGTVVATQAVVVGFHAGENDLPFSGSFTDISVLPTQSVEVKAYTGTVTAEAYAYKHIYVDGLTTDPSPAYVTQDITVTGTVMTDYAGTPEAVAGATVTLIGPDSATIATATSAADGTFSIAFNPGETYGTYTVKVVYPDDVFEGTATFEVKDYELVIITSHTLTATEYDSQPTAPFTATAELTVGFATTTVPSKVIVGVSWYLDDTTGLGSYPGFPLSVAEEEVSATLPVGVASYTFELSHQFEETPTLNVWVSTLGENHFYWRKFTIVMDSEPAAPLYVTDTATLYLGVLDETGTTTNDYGKISLYDPDGALVGEVSAPPFPATVALVVTFEKSGTYTLKTRYGAELTFVVSAPVSVSYNVATASIYVEDAAGQIWDLAEGDAYSMNGQPEAPITGTYTVAIEVTPTDAVTEGGYVASLYVDGSVVSTASDTYLLARNATLATTTLVGFNLDAAPENDMYLVVTFYGTGTETIKTATIPIWQKWEFEGVKPEFLYINHQWTIEGDVVNYKGEPAMDGAPVYLADASDTILASATLSGGKFAIEYTFTEGGTYTLKTLNGTEYQFNVAEVIPATVTAIDVAQAYSLNAPEAGATITISATINVADHPDVAVYADIAPVLNIDGTEVVGATQQIVVPAGVNVATVALEIQTPTTATAVVKIGVKDLATGTTAYAQYPLWEKLSIAYGPESIYQNVSTTITGTVTDYAGEITYPYAVVALANASGTILATTAVAEDGTFSIAYTFDEAGTYYLKVVEPYYAEVALTVQEAYAYQPAIASGWNLISVPVTSTKTFKQLFHMSPEGVSAVYYLEGDVFYNHQDKTPHFGYGYFVKNRSTSTITYEVVGIPTNEPVTLTIHQGWNAIGNPFTHEIDFGKIDIIVGDTTYHGLAEALDAGIVGYGFWYKNDAFVVANYDTDVIPVGAAFVFKLKVEEATIVINP